jgi:2-amino-4-hydroxy-6-hydroxymethyldihydropteridine diphosphokinase
MHQVFLGIGGNIGEKLQNFKKVSNKIENLLGTIISISSIYETPPWGFESDNPFWNQVIHIETSYSAFELLEKIQNIEKDFGRKKTKLNYADREIDIDILYFDDEIIESEKLIVPHPKIQLRKFVLVPLVEIAPELIHPLFRMNSRKMLEYCNDNSLIKRIKQD